MSARQQRCLEQEAAVYRKALVRLYCLATNGNGRKTIDKSEVAQWAGQAIETGNGWSRQARES